MHLIAQNRKLVSVVTAIAVLAVMIPAVFMIGCTMPMTKMLCDWAKFDGVTLSQACGGTWVTTHGPAALVSAGLSTLIFALALAFVASARMLFITTRQVAPALVRAEPPPRPVDPLGERLTL
jgi:hypothetical protein